MGYMGTVPTESTPFVSDDARRPESVCDQSEPFDPLSLVIADIPIS